MKIFLFILFILLSPPSFGQGFSFTGTGQLTCGEWAEAVNYRNDNQQNVVVQWLAGYIGAYNYYSPEEFRITSSDLATIKLWLTTYCNNNPLHRVFMAGSALIEDLGGNKALHEWK